MHRAAERLSAACARVRPTWRLISELHAGLHGAIVDASESDRLQAAYAGLAGELQLYVLQLRPTWPLERMASQHEALVAGLETEGAEALRRHLREGFESVLEPT